METPGPYDAVLGGSYPPLPPCPYHDKFTIRLQCSPSDFARGLKDSVVESVSKSTGAVLIGSKGPYRKYRKSKDQEILYLVYLYFVVPSPGQLRLPLPLKETP